VFIFSIFRFTFRIKINVIKTVVLRRKYNPQIGEKVLNVL